MAEAAVIARLSNNLLRLSSQLSIRIAESSSGIFQRYQGSFVPAFGSDEEVATGYRSAIRAIIPELASKKGLVPAIKQQEITKLTAEYLPAELCVEPETATTESA